MGWVLLKIMNHRIATIHYSPRAIMYEAWPRQRSLRVAFERRDKIGLAR